MFAQSRQPYTLNKIVNLFMYVFYIVANGVQYARKTNVLTFNLELYHDDFVHFQLIVLGISLLFNACYIFLYPHYKYRASHGKIKKKEIPNVYKKTILFLCCISVLYVIAKFASHPLNLFFRGVTEDFAGMRSSGPAHGDVMSLLIFEKIIRPFSFTALLASLLCKTNKNVRKYLFILALIANCPTALARNAAAMIWIPIFLALYGKNLKNNIFMWVMIFALFFLFPFFNNFRHYDGHVDITWSLDFFNDINFDASEIFIATMKVDFITYGRQLLGALLFFFPRRFWPNKPGGSGSELVEYMDGYFSNVSMPFFAEGYVNFGYFGVIIFTIFLAWLSVKLDNLYWFKWSKSQSLKRGYYYILIGAIIFIMRGDLMSSFAYTIGLMLCYTLCIILCTNYHYTRLRVP